MASPFIPIDDPSQVPSDLQVVSGLQARFGTIDYTKWQTLRFGFYSWLTYPEAGQNQFVFFGNAVGSAVGATTLTYEDTNMPQAANFGQVHFLIKTIHTDIRIADLGLNTYAGTDATTLASDFLMGFVNAGTLNFSIGARPFLTVPKPFQYLPPLAARSRAYGAGLTAVTAVGPLTAYQTDQPFVTQTSNRDNVFRFDPSLLVEAGQQFSVTVDFPSGLVPVIGTSITDNTTNPLKIGVFLSGVVLRPMQ